jgi:hypothetical protein
MRSFFTRESFIPKGAVKVADKRSDAVAYLYANASGKPLALVFFGRQQKPVGHYSFRDEAKRSAYIARAFALRQHREAAIASTRSERKAFRHSLKVGDVLNTCWGYEQTNREFYQVTEVRGADVVVREIGQERITTAFDQGRAVPALGAFIGEPLRRRVGLGNALRITKCQRATPSSFAEIAGVKVYDAVSWSSYA